MNRFRLSLEAAQDVIDIFEYIAQDSPDAAERVRSEIFDALIGLIEFPGKGHRRDDLTRQSVLFWPVPPYLVIYRQESDPLEIVAVLHGKRNIKKILAARTKIK
jgi:antitoxin ParD1/3/4